MEEKKERPPEFEIPKEVREAMKIYYDHQVLANTTFDQYHETEPDKVYHWDKDTDEDVFSKTTEKCGVSYLRVAGTFYLTVPYNDKFYVTVVTHNKDDVNQNGYLVRIYERKPKEEKRENNARFENII
jgi:hypothetical protein